MPTLTKGYLRARPFRITANTTLAAVATALDNRKPNGANLTRGWGSIYDDESFVGSPQTVPPANDTVILPAEDRGDLAALLPLTGLHASQRDLARPTQLKELPQDLAARVYWWQPDPALRRVLGPGVDPSAWSRLRAADILLSSIAGSPDFTLLVTSHNAGDITKEVLPALQLVLTSLDGGATISAQSVLELPSDDFFLWMVHRTLEGLRIDGDLEISVMRSVYVQDALDHGTYLWKGVDSSRMDLMGYIADAAKSFGPARVVVRSDLLGGLYDFDLTRGGDFNVHIKETQYDDTDGLTESQVRIQMVRDLAHVVIPELKDVYSLDTSWAGTVRPAYRIAQKALLQAAAAAL